MPTDHDRLANALALAEELLADIELNQLQPPQIVLKASRLARLARDAEAQQWLRFELEGYPLDGSDTDAVTRAGRWADRDKGTAYVKPLSNLSSLAESERAKLAMMQNASFSGDYIVTASRNHQDALDATSRTISTLGAVEGAVLSNVYSWVTRSYHELLFSSMQSELWASTQAEIDSRLIPLSGLALDKIEAIGERLRAGDKESVSHAMSTVRRLLVAAADGLFPARDEPFQLGGQALSVKSNAVLNRLNAYVAGLVSSQGRRDRLRHSLKDIWERASAGDHADIEAAEARYVFLQTYVVLGEILSLGHPQDD